MLAPLSILFGAAFTVAVCLALGRMILRALPIALYRQEEGPLAFVLGGACLSLLVFLICALHVAHRGVFLAAGLGVLALAVWRGAHHRPHGESFAPLPAFWRWLFRAVFAVFFAIYFVNAMAPEMSPDGSTYHLGLVSRYLRAHGFERITTDLYANFSQGVEMLFLFSFAFGRHSAAALTHFAFLVMLPFAMLSYARRFGFPVAGICGALLVFVSPVVGIDGTSAYNDVATACIVFTAFYLAQIWMSTDSNAGLLAPLGLVAGFGYAAKYTAFLAVPYALGIVAWKCMRSGTGWFKPLLLIGGCASIMIAPWAIKNTLWLGNPVSPFFNAVFPNPYVRISFENDYKKELRHYPGVKDAEIPLEVTVRGDLLSGLLGPVFLLAPLALLALRFPAGRQLLLAGLLFGIPYIGNTGTRFLLPALPFVALSMGMAVAGSSAAAALLIVAHAVLSWPAIIPMYSSPYAWRLTPKIPWKQALRIESEASFLNFRMPSWATAQMLDRLVPKGAKVFTFSGAAEAYTAREILVSFQSAFGSQIQDILYVPLLPDFRPEWLLRFRYPAQSFQELRVTQTATGEPDQWSVAEFRIFRSETELPRAPDWKLRARPDPWDVQLAFDNSPVTRWRSWETIHPGMSLSVEFGKPEVSDSVLLECAHDQYKIRLELEGKDSAGNWKKLGAPEQSRGEQQAGLRRAAAEEVKARGIDYILIYDSDFASQDFIKNARLWGATPLGEHEGARLYRFD